MLQSQKDVWNTAVLQYNDSKIGCKGSIHGYDDIVMTLPGDYRRKSKFKLLKQYEFIIAAIIFYSHSTEFYGMGPSMGLWQLLAL